VQIAGIDGNQDVGGGVAAFEPQPLQQFVRAAGQQIDGDPRIAGEVVEQGLDQVLLTCGVQVDFAIGVDRRGEAECGPDGRDCEDFQAVTKHGALS